VALPFALDTTRFRRGAADALDSGSASSASISKSRVDRSIQRAQRHDRRRISAGRSGRAGLRRPLFSVEQAQERRQMAGHAIEAVDEHLGRLCEQLDQGDPGSEAL
jgi:hypothetical protein